MPSGSSWSRRSHRARSAVGLAVIASLLLAACAPAAPAPPAKTEAKPTEAAKPAAAPAATTGPAKPVEASKPTEVAKPAAEAKPAEKPAEKPAAAGQVGPKQTFVWGQVSDPANLDPHFSLDGYAGSMIVQAYEKLLRYKAGSKTELEGELAESWTASPDGLTWTFKLRPNTKFADGTPLDGAAVKWSFERLFGLKAGPSTPLSSVNTVEAPDPRTVVITLKQPFAPFASALTQNGASIVNPKVMQHEKDGDQAKGWLATNMMGSGLFQQTEWVKGQRLVMDIVPDHWSGRGQSSQIRRLIAKIVTELSDLRLQLEKGDIDHAYGLEPSQTRALADKPGIMIYKDSFLDFIYIYLMSAKPPFDKKELRQALAYAIDNKKLSDELLGDGGRALNGPIGFGMLCYDESNQGYPYDPAKAQQLLTQAGYPGGRGLDFEFLYSTSTVGAEEVVVAVQAMWSAVGVNARVTKIAEATRRERIDKGDTQATLGQWQPGPPDPYNTMNRWYDSRFHGLGVNRAFYTNPQVDELIRKGEVATSEQERCGFYRQAQKIAVDDAPYITIYQQDLQLAVRKEVQGFNVAPNSRSTFDFSKMSKS